MFWELIKEKQCSWMEIVMEKLWRNDILANT